MRRGRLAALGAVAALGLGTVALQEANADPTETQADAGKKRAYEVWHTDQSGTGGKLYIYAGKDLENGAPFTPEVVDLGSELAPICTTDVEGVPNPAPSGVPTRAHIVTFSPDSTRALISFVGSGHVAVLDAKSRAPIDCFDVGEQAHATFPAPNGRYAMIANQSGKKLVRLDTDVDGDGRTYEDDADMALVPGATLDVAGACATPSGAPCEQPGIRPLNTIICPIVEATSQLTFVTLGGGGMLVVDTSRGDRIPPIVAEYDSATVHPHGCGGMQGKSISSNSRIYFNAGAGATHPSAAYLYSFPSAPSAYGSGPPSVNVPAPKLIFASGANETNRDSHGLMLNVARSGRYLWAGDRAANRIEVVDTVRDVYIGSFSLEGAASSDPAPDLLAVAPNGRYAFAALRGPCTLTANVAAVGNAVGTSPGVGIIEVRDGGRSGALVAVAPMTNLANPATACAPIGGGIVAERADGHAIAVRLAGR